MIYINNLPPAVVRALLDRKTGDLFEKTAKSSDIKSIVDCAESVFTVRLLEGLDKVFLEKPEDYDDKLMGIDRTLAQSQDDSSDDSHTAGIDSDTAEKMAVTFIPVHHPVVKQGDRKISKDKLNTLRYVQLRKQ